MSIQIGSTTFISSIRALKQEFYKYKQIKILVLK